MKVTVKIGTCEVILDDGNAPEPASIRWKDQYERIKELVGTTSKCAIDMHSQQMGDDKQEVK